jgi:hypothetical protein
VRALQMPKEIWNQMIEIARDKIEKGTLDKPIVFALYTQEKDHSVVIGYREITTVELIRASEYSNGNYNYKYPGIKKLGFYPPSGTGKWFSGTLVIGDGIELDPEDQKWMVKDQMDFRIKLEIDQLGKVSYKTYCVDFPAISLELHEDT